MLRTLFPKAASEKKTQLCNVNKISNVSPYLAIMKMKRYEVNVREIELKITRITEGIYKSSGLHKAFNKGGIHSL